MRPFLVASAALLVALAGCGRTGLLVPALPTDASAEFADGAIADEILAPRPVAPLSTGFATSRTPTLHWALPPGTDGAQVDLCRDRACTRPLATLIARGNSIRVPSELPTGVNFWRLRGTRGGRTGSAFSPTWQFAVGSRSAPVDTSWGSRLDINGDGFGDLIVSDTFVAGRTGRLYAYLGGPSGLPMTPSSTFDGPDGPQGTFGSSVRSAGDVDGDGYCDIVVDALGLNGAVGRAYVVFGSADGLSTDRIARFDPPGALRIGGAAAGLGDIDADGYADVGVGVAGTSMAPNPPGSVMVFRGGAHGPENSPRWTLSSGVSMHDFYALLSAGDVNGDGFSDMIGPAPNFNPEEGRAYLYLGGANGPAASNVYRFRGMPLGYYGDAAPAGDINGDGFVDLLVGGEGTSGYSGWAELYLASASGVSTAPRVVLGDTGEPFGFLTGDLGTIGDVDGDGLDDFAVGASVGNHEYGRVTVYYGDASGTPTRHAELLGAPTPAGEMWLAHFGASFAGVNDYDGDGIADFAVGAYGQESLGAVVLYHGARGGLASTPWITIHNPTTFMGTFGLVLAMLEQTRRPTPLRLQRRSFGTAIGSRHDLASLSRSCRACRGRGGRRRAAVCHGTRSTRVGNVRRCTPPRNDQR